MDYSQFKGKPFQVVSKLGVRYTGIFDHISQEDQTICLSQVYNHGSENRPTKKKLPGSNVSLGWVRFHTESIESLAIVEDYKPPGVVEEEVDPILASVSKTAPGEIPQPAPAPVASTSSVPKPPLNKPQPPNKPSSADISSTSNAPIAGSSSTKSPAKHDLPSKPPVPINNTATTALDRVQASLSELSMNGGGGGGGSSNQNAGQRRYPYKPKQQPTTAVAAPIEVPNTPFDFSKGTDVLEAEREARRGRGKSRDEGNIEGEDLGDPEHEPHPAAIQGNSNGNNSNGNGNGIGLGNGGSDAGTSENVPGGKASSAYKKTSFFDGLSGESSRISRAEERGRNLDTFGEAGGPDQQGVGGMGGNYGRGRGGGFGNRGRGGGYRGGYNSNYGGGQAQGDRQQGYGGYGGQNQGYQQGQGYGRGGYTNRGRGGYRGGYQQQQQQQNQDL